MTFSHSLVKTVCLFLMPLYKYYNNISFVYLNRTKYIMSLLQLPYKHMEFISRVSAHAGRKRELCLSAHGDATVIACTCNGLWSPYGMNMMLLCVVSLHSAWWCHSSSRWSLQGVPATDRLQWVGCLRLSFHWSDRRGTPQEWHHPNFCRRKQSQANLWCKYIIHVYYHVPSKVVWHLCNIIVIHPESWAMGIILMGPACAILTTITFQASFM